MLSEIKPKLNPFIEAIAKPFAKINPNILSIVGLIFPILFFYFMFKHDYGWALVMMLGTSFDMLDGAVARLSNKITKFGALLDSTLDRFSDALIIMGFYYGGIVSVELALIALIASYMISYIRSRAELAAKGEFVLNVGIMERPERILFLTVILIIKLIPPIAALEISGFYLTTVVYIALIVLSFITIFQRMFIAKQRLSKV